MLTNGIQPTAVDVTALPTQPVRSERSSSNRGASENSESRARREDDASYGRSLQRELRKSTPPSSETTEATKTPATDAAPATEVIDEAPIEPKSPPPAPIVEPEPITRLSDRYVAHEANESTELSNYILEQVGNTDGEVDTRSEREALVAANFDVAESRPEIESHPEVPLVQDATVKPSNELLDETSFEVSAETHANIESKASVADAPTVQTASTYLLQAPASFELPGSKGLPTDAVNAQDVIASEEAVEVVTVSTAAVPTNVPPPKSLHFEANTTHQSVDEPEAKPSIPVVQATVAAHPPESLFGTTSQRIGEHQVFASSAIQTTQTTDQVGAQSTDVAPVVEGADVLNFRTDPGTPLPDSLRVVPTSQTQMAGELEPEVRVDQARVVERVSQMIRATEQSGRVLRARLHPPELGALQVEVTRGATGIIARLDVETPAAQRLIMDHLSQLHDALSLTGLVERIDVQVAASSESNADDTAADEWAFAEQQQSEENDGKRENNKQQQDERAVEEDEPAADAGVRAEHQVSRSSPTGRGVDLSELDVAV